jgi:hypothetical protein
VARPFTLKRLTDLYKRAEESTCDVFWRHDVDYSLDAAWQMAKLESDLGVQSTYYFFHDERWPFYTNNESYEVAHDIHFKLGHEVGTHVDERFVDSQDYVTIFMLGEKLSFHCPTSKQLWQDDADMWESAYNVQWKGHYVADSRGEFPIDPEDLLHLYKLQVNLHSEWWFRPDWLSEVPFDLYEAHFYEPHPNTPFDKL